MKSVLMIVCVLIGLTAGGIAWRKHKARVDTEADINKRVQEEMASETLWREQATAGAMEIASNRIVGLQRVVKVDTGFVPMKYSELKPDTNRWEGEVIADYVNHVGGVERTNVPVVYRLVGDRIMTDFDLEKDYQEFQKRIAAMDAARQ